MSFVKFFVLLGKRSLSLIRGSSLLAGILAIFQIVVSVAFIVSCTTMFENQNKEDISTMSRRAFEVSFKTPIKTPKDIISQIEGGIGEKIYNVSIFFKGIINETEVDLEALLYPHNDPTVIGEKITEDDSKNTENKLIAPADTVKYGLKSYDIGEKVFINGIEYTVIGNRANDFEIPLQTGIDNFKMDSIEVKIKNNVGNQDFLNYGQYFKDTFGEYDNVRIIIPPTPKQRTGSKLSLHIIISAVMLITALISFVSVFSYIITKCKHEYIILSICGASIRYTVFLMLTQMVFQFTVSYLISVMLIAIINIFSPENSVFLFNLRFDVVLIVYLFSVTAIFVMSLPHVLKMVRNSIAINKQSNEGERI